MLFLSAMQLLLGMQGVDDVQQGDTVAITEKDLEELKNDLATRPEWLSDFFFQIDPKENLKVEKWDTGQRDNLLKKRSRKKVGLCIAIVVLGRVLCARYYGKKRLSKN